jgi:hypothetical protein
MDRKFIQICPVVVGGRIVIYGLDGVGRVWRMVDGEEGWSQLPFRRQDEPEEAARSRWTSTSRRPLNWLDLGTGEEAGVQTP